MGSEYLDLVTNGSYNKSLNSIFELPLDAIIDNYSTGMKKKLAFWGAYEQDKDVVILDEPFNGVDVESVECFFLLIDKMKKNGKIVLLSSHIIDTLTHSCDSIVYLKDGQIKQTYEEQDYDNLVSDIKSIIRSKIDSIL